MITAMSLTNGTLTVVLDNGASILTARNDHPKWTEIVEAFKVGNETLLHSLISLKSVVEAYSVGELSINSTGVTYRGQPMHSVDSSRVMAFLRDGLPYKPIANYIARKMANPSARAIAELYNFLEHKNMPLTPEGKIIAYKGVQKDLYSVHGNTKTVVVKGTVNSEGKILNEIGAIIEIERSSCDDDFRNGCSFGLHAGSLSYAKGWGPRVVLVEIDPADVVSVPDDCNCQKLRCCKYKVIGEYTGPMPDTLTTEFSDPDETSPLNDETEGGEPECECESEEDQSSEVSEQSSEIKQDIERRVRGVVCEILGIADEDLKSTTILRDLGADSLDAVELVMGFEEEFGEEIGDNEAEDLENKPFSAIVDYIYGLTQKPDSVTSDSDDNYLNGMKAGVQDRAAGKRATYISGDQDGADSDAHAKFIEGYINGYA